MSGKKLQLPCGLAFLNIHTPVIHERTVKQVSLGIMRHGDGQCLFVTPFAAAVVVVGVATVVVVIGSYSGNSSKVFQMTGWDYFFPIMASCVLLWNCYIFIGWMSECVHWSSWGAPQHWCRCHWCFAVAFWEELCLCNSCNNSSTTIALLFLKTLLFWWYTLIRCIYYKIFVELFWITLAYCSFLPTSLSFFGNLVLHNIFKIY